MIGTLFQVVATIVFLVFVAGLLKRAYENSPFNESVRGR